MKSNNKKIVKYVGGYEKYENEDHGSIPLRSITDGLGFIFSDWRLDNEIAMQGLDAIKCDFASSIDTIKNNINKTILLHSSKQSRISPTPAKVSLGILENPPPLTSFNKENLPIAVLLEGEFESVFKNRILPKNQKLNFVSQSKKVYGGNHL